MKATFSSSVLTFLLVTASSQCFAEITVGDVSPARAKTLGVTLRTEKNGDAGVKVWLGFKTKGELEKFNYIELQIGDGEDRIMSAPFLVSHPSQGSVVVTFSAYPAYLPRSTLMIVVYDGPEGDVGYRFKVKDFIGLDKPP